MLGRFQDRAVADRAAARAARRAGRRAGRPAALMALGSRARRARSPTSSDARDEFASASRRSPHAQQRARARHVPKRRDEGRRDLLDQGRRRQDVGGRQPRRARRRATGCAPCCGTSTRRAPRRSCSASSRRSRAAGSKLIRGKREPLAVMKGTDVEGLDLLPGRLLLPPPRHPARQAQEAAAAGWRACSRSSTDDYDLAILDCAPSISLVSESVFAAADLLLVPLVPSTLAVRTLEQLQRVPGRGPGAGARACSRSSRWSTAARSCTAS